MVDTNQEKLPVFLKALKSKLKRRKYIIQCYFSNVNVLRLYRFRNIIVHQFDKMSLR